MMRLRASAGLTSARAWLCPASGARLRVVAAVQLRVHEFATSSGAIKRWNGEKGFGFISRDDGGGDVFVHRTGVKSDGFRAFALGERVEFELVEDADGRGKAADVTGPGGGELQGPWQEGEVPEEGVVARWREDKGFGFITPQDGGDDVFVHQTAIFATGFRALVVGDTVEYSVAPDDSGRMKCFTVCAPGGQVRAPSSYRIPHANPLSAVMFWRG